MKFKISNYPINNGSVEMANVKTKEIDLDEQYDMDSIAVDPNNKRRIFFYDREGGWVRVVNIPQYGNSGEITVSGVFPFVATNEKKVSIAVNNTNQLFLVEEQVEDSTHRRICIKNVTPGNTDPVYAEKRVNWSIPFRAPRITWSAEHGKYLAADDSGKMCLFNVAPGEPYGVWADTYMKTDEIKSFGTATNQISTVTPDGKAMVIEEFTPLGTVDVLGSISVKDANTNVDIVCVLHDSTGGRLLTSFAKDSSGEFSKLWEFAMKDVRWAHLMDYNPETGGYENDESQHADAMYGTDSIYKLNTFKFATSGINTIPGKRCPILTIFETAIDPAVWSTYFKSGSSTKIYNEAFVKGVGKFAPIATTDEMLSQGADAIKIDFTNTILEDISGAKTCAVTHVKDDIYTIHILMEDTLDDYTVDLTGGKTIVTKGMSLFHGLKDVKTVSVYGGDIYVANKERMINVKDPTYAMNLESEEIVGSFNGLDKEFVVYDKATNKLVVREIETKTPTYDLRKISMSERLRKTKKFMEGTETYPYSSHNPGIMAYSPKKKRFFYFNENSKELMALDNMHGSNAAAYSPPGFNTWINKPTFLKCFSDRADADAADKLYIYDETNDAIGIIDLNAGTFENVATPAISSVDFGTPAETKISDMAFLPDGKLVVAKANKVAVFTTNSLAIQSIAPFQISHIEVNGDNIAILDAPGKKVAFGTLDTATHKITFSVAYNIASTATNMNDIYPLPIGGAVVMTESNTFILVSNRGQTSNIFKYSIPATMKEIMCEDNENIMVLCDGDYIGMSVRIGASDVPRIGDIVVDAVKGKTYASGEGNTLRTLEKDAENVTLGIGYKGASDDMATDNRKAVLSLDKYGIFTFSALGEDSDLEMKLDKAINDADATHVILAHFLEVSYYTKKLYLSDLLTKAEFFADDISYINDINYTEGNRSITVTWTPNEKAGVAKTEIWYRKDGGDWVLYGGALDPDGTTIDNLDARVRYDFRLKVLDSSDILLQQYEFFTYPSDTEPPAPITGQTFTTTQMTGDDWNKVIAHLTWNNPTGEELAAVRLAYGKGTADTTISLGGSVESFDISGLEIGVEYTFELVAIDLSKNHSQKTVFTYTPVDIFNPGEVHNISAEISPQTGAEDTESTVVLKWDPPTDKDLDHFEVIHGKDISNPIATTNVDKANNQLAIEHIEYNTEYTYRVIAVDAVGNKSEAVEYKLTTTDVFAPAPITNITRTQVQQPGAMWSQVVMTLNWDEPTSPDLDHIELSYGETGTFDNTIHIPKGTTTRDIEHLNINTTYNFRFKSVDILGNKSEEIIQYITPRDVYPPGPVSNVGSTQEKQTGNEWVECEVTLNWTLPADEDLKEIIIDYGPTGNLNKKVTLAADATSATLEHIPVGHEYTYQVKTVDKAANESTVKEHKRTCTDVYKPGNITDLAITYVQDPSNLWTEAQLTMNWTDPVDPDLERVEIRYRESGSSSPEMLITALKGVETAQIRHISIGVAYDYTIQTVDKVGNKADPVTVKHTATDVFPPSVVKDVKVETREMPGAEGEKCIARVSWTLPDDEDIKNVRLISFDGTETLPGTATYFEIPNVPYEQPFNVRLVVIDNVNLESGEISYTITPTDTNPPTKPGNVSHSINTDNGVLHFDCDAPTEADVDAGFIEVRRMDGEPLTESQLGNLTDIPLFVDEDTGRWYSWCGIIQLINIPLVAKIKFRDKKGNFSEEAVIENILLKKVPIPELRVYKKDQSTYWTIPMYDPSAEPYPAYMRFRINDFEEGASVEWDMRAEYPKFNEWGNGIGNQFSPQTTQGVLDNLDTSLKYNANYPSRMHDMGYWRSGHSPSPISPDGRKVPYHKCHLTVKFRAGKVGYASSVYTTVTYFKNYHASGGGLIIG